MKFISQLKMGIAVLLIANTPVFGAITHQAEKDSSAKRYLEFKDYDQWQFAASVVLPKKGDWSGVVTGTFGKDYAIRLINLRAKRDTVIKNISGATFSADGKWVLLSKVLPGSEMKKLKKEGKSLPGDMLLLNLATLKSTIISNVSRSEFSSSGKMLAYSRVKDVDRILVLRDLTSGSELAWGNVNAFTWNDKKELLAISLKSKDKEANSVMLYNPEDRSLAVLDKQKVEYSLLKWMNEGKQLIALRSIEDTSYLENTHEILVWNNVLKSKKPGVFRQEIADNFPQKSRLTGNRIQISDDGSKVFFEISYRTPKQKASDEKAKKAVSEDVPKVEIWNSRDGIIISEQKASANKSSIATKQAVWFVDSGNMVPIEDELTEEVSIMPENSVLIGSDQTPYEFDAWFGRRYIDVYSVDVASGSRIKLLSKVPMIFGIDPSSRYFVYLADNNLHLYDIKSRTSRNVTQSLDDPFVNRENDYTLPYHFPYGFAGWLKDGKSCLVYSEYDVWQLFVDGTMKRITKGKESGITYRNAQKADIKKPIDPKEPFIYKLFDKNTKSSGLAIGRIGDEIKTVVYEPAMVMFKEYSKDNQVLAFSKSNFEKAPDIYVADLKMSRIDKVTSLNEFQSRYHWGKSELMVYTNPAGKKLQGILYYPANYQKGKKYPMITYVYEKLSDGLHAYLYPLKTDFYNIVTWQQNGYFVLTPDIEFEAGNPGVSSARSLEKAVAAVVAKGDVDRAKVGLIGHSWGGYQAGFVPTQTNIFAASVAGAGLTDLVSMYLSITPAFSGKPENNHFEVLQERMEVAPWIAPQKYLANSSVMQIEKLNSPMLLEVGDKDTNVNWSQGVAYYNAARRAGKNLVMLVYNDEGHSFRSESNSHDYQQRILSWFGHYLKGEPAPDWIIRGIPYNEQLELLKRGK